MSISTVSNRWLNRCYKCLAISLVLLAVLISALRLFFPYVNNYRQSVQDFINTTYNSNVIIGSLSMEWQKVGPAIVIEKISLFENDSVTAFVNKIDVSLNFWQSLVERRIITGDFTLDGAKVIVESSFFKTDTTVDIKDESKESLEERIADIFLERVGQFSLNNSQFIYRTDTHENTFLINQLHWLNDGNRHRAKGGVIVDGLTSNNFNILLDIEGDDISNMNGQLYVDANKLNITAWLDKIIAIDDDKTDSTINFNAWLTIANGLPKEFQVVLGKNEISWQHKDVLQTFSISSGQIFATDFVGFNQFNFYSSPLQIVSNGQPWQPILLETRHKQNELFAYVSSVELSGVADLYPLFAMNEDTRNFIDNLAINGKLNELYFHQLRDDIYASAQIVDVSSKFSSGIPGIEHVDGELYFARDKLNIIIEAKEGALDFDKHLMLPIAYNSLKAALNVNFDEQGWQLKANNIELLSKELKLAADIVVKIPKDGLVSMSLLANVLDGDAKSAEHYYPLSVMGDDLISYLNGAIVDGNIEQAQVLFNGPITKFPFEDNSGVFAVDVELTDSIFKFDSEWPEIKDFAANLSFTNNSMLITGRSGGLEGIDATGVEVAIASLSEQQILSVKANFTDTKPALVRQLMNHSPMANTIGKTLEQLVISNTISGVFSLTLPLNNIKDVIAEGSINFNHNNIALTTPRMDFSNVNGQLNYRNDVITAKSLTMNWRGLPLTLAVNAKDHNDYFGTDIHIDAGWMDKNWLEQVPVQLKKYAKGALQWQGDLSLNMHHEGGFSYDLDINSTLDKMTLDLPAPYSKALNESQNVNIIVTGQENTSTINAKLGEQLSFYGLLNHDFIEFSRVHLVLGDENMLLPMDGFHITTKLEYVDFNQWQPFIADIIETVNATSNTEVIENGMAEIQIQNHHALLTKPDRIRGTVNKFEALGQTLTDVSFNLVDQESWWLLHLNAKEVRSQIKFYPDWYNQGIDVDADFLQLTSNEIVIGEDTLNENNIKNEKDSQLVNDELFASLPPMHVHCDSCKYDKFDFGTVDFDIERTSSEILTLKKFTASRDKTELAFDVIWQHLPEGSKTSIVGSLTTKDVEDEIDKLGYPSTIKDSGLKSSFDFNWQGSPQEFSIASLNGNVGVHLDDGYLAEVPDQARVFSILSLQSLVRKLSLDFRDIFSDGMFYSEIKGDFNLKEGIVYTDNTKIKGAAGNLSIKGNTDLSNEMLDYRLSYKPNITSSLPALAWIATLNPVTFLAGIALEEVITSKVYYEMNFELTGHIDNPVFKDVNRKTRNIRVGRTTPPEIIDESTLPEKEPKTFKEKLERNKEKLKAENNNG